MMAARGRAAAVVVAVAAAAALVSWPSAGFALCPNCLGQRDTLTPTLELVGLFLLVPFAVAAVLLRIVRRAMRASDDPPRS
jgi:hypothetical protein